MVWNPISERMQDFQFKYEDKCLAHLNRMKLSI